MALLVHMYLVLIQTHSRNVHQLQDVSFLFCIWFMSRLVKVLSFDFVSKENSGKVKSGLNFESMLSLS